MRIPFGLATRSFVVLVVAAALAGVGNGVLGSDAVLASSTHGKFRIHGHVTGLYPGKFVPLRLTIVNRYRFAIVVTTVRVTVKNASRSCTAPQLTITRFRGRLTVRPRHSKLLVLRARLAAKDPDICQRARFPLRYHSTAVKRGAVR